MPPVRRNNAGAARAVPALLQRPRPRGRDTSICAVASQHVRCRSSHGKGDAEAMEPAPKTKTKREHARKAGYGNYTHRWILVWNSLSGEAFPFRLPRLRESSHDGATEPGKSEITLLRNRFARANKVFPQKPSVLIRERPMLGTILLIVLILILVGALPTWPHSAGWGYYPSGGIGLVVVVLLILVLMGRV